MDLYQVPICVDSVGRHCVPSAPKSGGLWTCSKESPTQNTSAHQALLSKRPRPCLRTAQSIYSGCLALRRFSSPPPHVSQPCPAEPQPLGDLRVSNQFQLFPFDSPQLSLKPHREMPYLMGHLLPESGTEPWEQRVAIQPLEKGAGKGPDPVTLKTEASSPGLVWPSLPPASLPCVSPQHTQLPAQ